MTTQVCRKCCIEKDLSEFSYRNDNKKHRSECKLCRATTEAAKRYNVTVGDIELLKEKQRNCCAICGTHADDIPHKSFSHNPLVIDHDHETGEVRALLCPTCNSGLGHFKDSPELLIKAAKYLTYHKRMKR